MQKIYSIIIAIYAFSLITTAINDPYADGSGGIFDTQLYEVGVNASVDNNDPAIISEVNDVQSSTEELSLFSLPGLLIKALKFMGAVLVNTAFVLPMLSKYGVPLGIGLIIQGIVTLVEGVGLIQFATNRSIGGMR